MQQGSFIMRKGLAVVIIALFLALGMQPCFVTQTRAATNPWNGQSGSVNVVCHLASVNSDEETTKSISVSDLQLLGELFRTNQRAFVEKACQLGLCGRRTPAEVLAIIDGATSSQKGSSAEDPANQHCRFTILGRLTELHFLPIPYFVYSYFRETYFIVAIMLLLFMIYCVTIGIPLVIFYQIIDNHPRLKKALQDLFDGLLPVYQIFIPWLKNAAARVKATVTQTWHTLGTLHALAPVKMPIHALTIATGNLSVSTSGDNGSWNESGNMSLTLWGFRGLWISLPSQEQADGIPTWCLGYAQNLVANNA